MAGGRLGALCPPVTAVLSTEINGQSCWSWLGILQCITLILCCICFPHFHNECSFDSISVWALVCICLHFLAKKVMHMGIMAMWKILAYWARLPVCILFSSVRLLNNVTVEHNYIVSFTYYTAVSGRSGSIAHFHLFIVFSLLTDWIKIERCTSCESPFTTAKRFCFMALSHAVRSVFLPWSQRYRSHHTVSVRSQPVCWASLATNPSNSIRNHAKLTQFMG